jgi:hypothetical protein
MDLQEFHEIGPIVAEAESAFLFGRGSANADGTALTASLR